MLNGFKVSDVDMHILEPYDLWERYIDPAFADEAPRFIDMQEAAGRGRLMVAGSLVTKVAGKNRESLEVARRFSENMQRWHAEFIEMGWSSEAQVMGMEKEGVDLAFLYPSHQLAAMANDDVGPDLALAIARAYNDWLNDFISYDRGRMIHIASVPLQNPQGAVQEIRRCAEEFGSKAVVVRGDPHHGRILDDPVYEDLWTELERLDLAVGVHNGTHSLVPNVAAHRFSTRLQSHTVSHPMEMMASMVTLIGSGVLERHPKLRVAFLEAGGGWLPYMLWRFDQQYDQLAFEVPYLHMKPSDYFRRQCWISVEPEEPNIQGIIDFLGEDYTVISSDFPHADHPPEELKDFSERNDISETVIRKTFWDNTMRFYKM